MHALPAEELLESIRIVVAEVEKHPAPRTVVVSSHALRYLLHQYDRVCEHSRRQHLVISDLVKELNEKIPPPTPQASG